MSIRNTLAASEQRKRSQDLRGSAIFQNAGSFKWKCPAGVTNISVVVIAAGTTGTYNNDTKIVVGGTGGNVRYKNNISVVPGQDYDILVGQVQWGQSPYRELTKSSAFGIVAYVAGVGGDSALSGGVGGGNGAIGNSTPSLNTIPGHGEPGRWDGGVANRVNVSIAQSKGIDVDGRYDITARFGKSGYFLKTSNAGQGTFNTHSPSAGGAVRIVWGAGREFPNTDVSL